MIYYVTIKYICFSGNLPILIAYLAFFKNRVIHTSSFRFIDLAHFRGRFIFKNIEILAISNIGVQWGILKSFDIIEVEVFLWIFIMK